ncbi:hypothetical protein [Chondrinema litorale]|uniref:hypothetical protein n=1 Tax=Chondrinema litorale TaxID=2994555 RepID=UPI002542B857|nr:hypothetical protein [Chondrinema litorale]UZR95898.1 hypothetical protein OQ292_08735 [Chondrinema litorale]
MQEILQTERSTSLHTYRNLPAYLRRELSVNDIFRILAEKGRYLSTLTYYEKCFISVDKTAGVIKRRLQKSEVYLSKLLIKQVLEAEENYYQHLLQYYWD